MLMMMIIITIIIIIIIMIIVIIIGIMYMCSAIQSGAVLVSLRRAEWGEPGAASADATDRLQG